MKLTDLCSDFITDCQINNKSNLTINCYSSELDKLVSYFANQNIDSVDELTPIKLREYFIETKTSRNIKPITLRRIMNTIRSLCNFGVENEVFVESPMSYIGSPKLKQTIMIYLTKEELNQLLRTLDSNPTFSLNVKVLIRFLIGTGVRRSELLGLKWRDINLIEKYVRVLGKGDAERLIPLSNQLTDWLALLKKSLTTQDKCENLSVFNADDKPLDRYELSKIINNTISEAKIGKKVTPHTFRRTFATLLIAEGESVVVVQKLLGHKCIQSTQIYTLPDFKVLQKAMEKFQL